MAFSLAPEQLKSAFPFHFVFDTQFVLLQYGHSLKKLLPEIAEGNKVQDYFQILRPRTIMGKIENIVKSLQQNFQLKIIVSHIELKGQMFYNEQEAAFLFVGYPVVKEQQQLLDWGLTINDFPLYDQTTDFLFLLQANRKTTQELENLSQQLNQQNTDLLNFSTQLQINLEMLQAREEEIRQNSEELLSINEDLNIAKGYLEQQKKELSSKNTYILASINYAKRIQDAILPSMHTIKELLPSSFVLFKPKDILSGDFYWVAQSRKKIVVAAVDCTGHGVPGAIMSVIIENLLDKIIYDQNITEPDWILESLHGSIRRILHQNEGGNNDSADLAICVIDTKNKIMEYAGARNSLYYFQQEEFRTIKADRFSVGGRQLEKGKRIFTKHVIALDKPIRFFIATDGFEDQFGGEENRKFLSQNFRKLLHETSMLSIEEQQTCILQCLLEWQGDYPQTDDILVMGVEWSFYG